MQALLWVMEPAPDEGQCCHTKAFSTGLPPNGPACLELPVPKFKTCISSFGCGRAMKRRAVAARPRVASVDNYKGNCKEGAYASDSKQSRC